MSPVQAMEATIVCKGIEAGGSFQRQNEEVYISYFVTVTQTININNKDVIGPRIDRQWLNRTLFLRYFLCKFVVALNARL